MIKGLVLVVFCCNLVLFFLDFHFNKLDYKEVLFFVLICILDPLTSIFLICISTLHPKCTVSLKRVESCWCWIKGITWHYILMNTNQIWGVRFDPRERLKLMLIRIGGRRLRLIQDGERGEDWSKSRAQRNWVQDWRFWCVKRAWIRVRFSGFIFWFIFVGV